MVGFKGVGGAFAEGAELVVFAAWVDGVFLVCVIAVDDDTAVECAFGDEE